MDWNNVNFATITRHAFADSTFTEEAQDYLLNCSLDQLKPVSVALPLMELRAQVALEQLLRKTLSGQPSRTGHGVYPTDMAAFLKQLQRETQGTIPPAS